MTDLNDFVRTRHVVSGAIDENTPRNILEHEILGKYLEEVGPDAKPYLPEMHRVTLPADANKDEIAAAKAAIDAGIVDADVVLKNEADKAPKNDDKNGKN